MSERAKMIGCGLRVQVGSDGRSRVVALVLALLIRELQL